jgi:hypothetical protein
MNGCIVRLARRTLWFATCVVWLLWPVAGHALTITPMFVTATSTAPLYDPIHLIDDSGLSNGLHDDNFENMWLSAPPNTSATLRFDLGSVHSIESVLIWQYNFPDALARGTSGLNISTSIDDMTLTFATGGFLSISPGGSIGPQTMALPAGTSARYVYLFVNSNFGMEDTIGLSEVKFVVASSTAAVPSLGTIGLVLLAGGLLLIGSFKRLRS